MKSYSWIGDDCPDGWKRVGSIDVANPADVSWARDQDYRIGTFYDGESYSVAEPCCADIYERLDDFTETMPMLDNTSAAPGMGHNSPPGPVAYASEAIQALSAFLADAPVVQDIETAKAGAAMVKRGTAVLADLAAERDGKVRPHNELVREVNALYKTATAPLARVVDELKRRLSAFNRAEEQRREAEAEAKRKAAEEARRLAYDAEQRERDALDSAAVGEIGVDIGSATIEADKAFADFGRADRMAARAEREIPVRLNTGFGRSLSLRTTEVLTVSDPAQALQAIGLTESIREAMLSSARAYRKLRGELPAGITSQLERKI